jgi:phage terminase large subunit-like protein
VDAIDTQWQSNAACNFFEGILKHTADEWYGKPFILAPWQERALENIFLVDDDGKRVIEMVYLEVPKKAGKSEFAAGVILFCLVAETTPGCQIYGAASATRQALNVYRAATKMVEQSAILQENLRILRGTNRILKRSDPDSFYAAIAADGDLGDGVNPSVTVADEVHRWKTRKQLENWDVLSNGGITRKQTLTVAITTAGVQSESPLAWRLHEKTKKIEKGIVADPKFYGKIFGADREDDAAAESTWIKANPSLIENGGFLDIGKIREKYVTHAAEGDLTSFKRYFLNIWDQKENLAIDMAKWDGSAGDWKASGLLDNPGPAVIGGALVDAPKVRPFPHEFLKRFVGRQCWAGVDLSMTTDTTAVALVFPHESDEERYDVLPFFWLPDAKIREMEKTVGVPLRKWADQGFLELSPGEVIDYRDIRARLEWASEMFDLQQICWDPWNSRQISVPMIEDGFKCEEIRQGYQSLSEATKKVLQLVATRSLNHGGHPVLRWQAGCAATITDGRDNIMFSKPDRSKTTSRIDGLAATVNAMARAMLNQTGSISYTGLRYV